MIDSPSAMMTKSWQRSARCSPAIVHSLVRERPSPGTGKPSQTAATSRTTASVQIARRASPSATAPASQKAPIASSQVETRWKFALSSCWRPITTSTQTVRPTWRATKAPANSRPRSSKASGIAADMNWLASIAPTSINRTGSVDGSNQFVIQAVYIHEVNTATSSRSVSPAPRRERCVRR